MSGSSERPSKPSSEPPTGGLSVADVAMQIARLSETVARQAEAIRILSDRVAMIESADQQEAPEPKNYLSGKPITR